MIETLAPAVRRPEPEALDPTEIDRLFVQLRGEREALMGEIGALQARTADASDPAAFIDLMEARVALNELLAYWRRLLARLLSIEQWAPLGSEEPRFADMSGDGRSIGARALVPLTPDSLLFVHGPVTIWHAAALAERLLEPGDRLARVVRCGFHRELKVEPRILVWDEGLGPSRVPYDESEAAVSGLFATASGREIAFAALPDGGAAPTRRAGWHPLTAAIIAEQPAKSAEPASFSHKLEPDCFPEAHKVRSGSDVLLAKSEALLAAITQNILVGERVLLLSRVLDLMLDADFGAWLASSPRMEMEIDWARQKPIPGRGAFVPVRYRILPDDPSWRRSMFVCLDSHLDF